MPKATVTTATRSFDLETVEGGNVKIKRMSYGEAVARRGLTKLSFVSDGKSNDFAGEMSMGSVDVQVYEFAHCLVEHNLTDEDDKPLNLTTRNGLDKLDPTIGEEIEKLISKVNGFDDDSEDGSKN